jgi:hypothetical protein
VCKILSNVWIPSFVGKPISESWKGLLLDSSPKLDGKVLADKGAGEAVD